MFTQKTFIIAVTLIASLSLPYSVNAASCPEDDPCESKGSAYEKISCYSEVVTACSSQRENMQSQVIYLERQVQLTTTKIAQSKEKMTTLAQEIDSLGEKISKLENSLTNITRVFLDRIVATYKYADAPYLSLMLTSKDANDVINRYKYVQTVQNHDRRLLFQLQNSKVNFEDQKILREEKKKELEDTRKQLEKEEMALAVQKKEKELFLETTRNSETRYQQELSAARREAEGIEKAASILSAAGVAKAVNRGDVIGVMGNTGFSTGAHLHFSVYNLQEADLNKFNFDGSTENPFQYITSRQMTFEPSSCDDVSPNDRTNKGIGSGSWDWPMANPIISQCYGHTPWSWRYRSGIHNGVDMWDDKDKLIRAVDSGNAYVYRGGQAAGNGVFIFHSNGKMTLYWHLQ